MLQRTALSLARRAAVNTVPRRAFTTTVMRRADKEKHDADHSHDDHGHGHGHGHEAKTPTLYNRNVRNMDKRISDIEEEYDLIPDGAAKGTVATDFEQATGLERLEILGKMDGVDVFDMKPLPSHRLGTLKDPIMVRSFGEEQYCGCTGSPADSHHVRWLTISRARPLGRCTECGSCYMMEYVGPEHVHHAERTEPPVKTMADFVNPEYYYR